VSLLDIPEEFRPFVKDNGTRVMLYGPLGPGSSLRGEVPEWLRSLPNINVLNLSGAGLTSLVRREALHRIPCGAGRNLVGCFWV
jgi:hypothetical protein